MASKFKQNAVFVGLCMLLAVAMLWGLSTADRGAAQAPSSDEAAQPAHDAVVEFGALSLSEAVIRETPPNAAAAAGFLTVANAGSEDDRLIAIKTDFAERNELHDMEVEDGVMRMREVEGGLVAPAGGALILDPATPGLHLMFIGLDNQLVEGEAYDVTLVFENAGEITLSFVVKRLMAHGGRSDHSGHDGQAEHSGHDDHTDHGEHGHSHN